MYPLTKENKLTLRFIIPSVIQNYIWPDTRLPQSRAGGQGPFLRSLDRLGRSSEAKDHKNPKKVKCDGCTNGRTDRRTDGRTDGPIKRGVESRSMRLNGFDTSRARAPRHFRNWVQMKIPRG